MMKLLVAEDNPKLLKSLIHIFEEAHYLVDGVSNGSEALEKAASQNYDGLVLDVMMPCMDGISLLQNLRKAGINTPALFLSARSETEDRIHGLDAGADDYLPKPFSSQELLARVRAMLRRRDHFSPDVQTILGLELDQGSMSVTYQGSRELLNRKEYNVLEMLCENRDVILSGQAILDKVWGTGQEGTIQSLAVHLSNLRQTLKKLGAPLKIRSIRGQGYRLEPSDD